MGFDTIDINLVINNFGWQAFGRSEVSNTVRLKPVYAELGKL